MIRIQQITVPATGSVPVSVVGLTYFDMGVVPQAQLCVIDPSGLDDGRFIIFGGFTAPVIFDFGVGCQIFLRTATAIPAGLMTIMTDMKSGDPV